MSKTINLEELRDWIKNQIDSSINPDYKNGISRAVPGLDDKTLSGVPVPVLRDTAREANTTWTIDPEQWARYISLVVPGKHREEIVAGALGLGKRAKKLEDLFGERASGWARDLDNWETTDQLSVPVGAWVLEDMSRFGYLEAWVNNGETKWKKRLGIAVTVQLNHGGQSHAFETFRVLRHVMSTDDPMLIKALGWAIREVKDIEATERFLAWWAPRCKKTLITQATKKLPKENRNRIHQLCEV